MDWLRLGFGVVCLIAMVAGLLLVEYYGNPGIRHNQAAAIAGGFCLIAGWMFARMNMETETWPKWPFVHAV